MKWTVLISFLSICISFNIIEAQKIDSYDKFLEFAELYNKGDFINAEKCMLHVLNLEENQPLIYYIYAYNNLGLVKKSLGLYTEALGHYDEAEKLSISQNKISIDLADIYNNKSRIYTFWKSFSTASEFLEKSIRICSNINNPDKNLLLRISRYYLNLGIVYYESGDYKKALENIEESLKMKEKYNLSEIELTYLNLAKTYAKTGDIINAEVFFIVYPMS